MLVQFGPVRGNSDRLSLGNVAHSRGPPPSSPVAHGSSSDIDAETSQSFTAPDDCTAVSSAEYVDNATWPHRTLALEPPQGSQSVQLDGEVMSIPVLGGIDHRYEREAA